MQLYFPSLNLKVFTKHKQISLLLIVFFFSVFTKTWAGGGCMSVQISTEDRVKNSTRIVEGEVLSKYAYQEREGKADIYTVQEIKVYRSFKGGVTPSVIYVVTRGGQVGLLAMKTTAENDFTPGDLGVFFLKPAGFGLQHAGTAAASYYEVYAAEQGFLRYNIYDNTATGPYDKIENIPAGVDNWMRSYLPANPIVVQPGPTQLFPNPKTPGVLTVPTITSFSPTTVTSGTRTLLTITGSGFGATRGTGFVEFRNANDPGNITWVQPKVNDYKVWNNTTIQVLVPSSSLGGGAGAGTGQIRVTNSTAVPNVATSSGTLTITYAAINIEYNATGQATEHQNNNGTGGYTFQYHSTEFSGNAAATASFVRAMNSWTCATNINWVIGATTTLDVVADDDINVVRFDNGAELPAGVAGRATSYFSGCINGAAPADTVWECNEIDVAFDDGLSWQFGPALPSLSQIDFESVAVHELGHAHQLNHVINTAAVMHATVSFGASNRSLSAASEVPGGTFQMTKATVTHGACKPAAEVMTPLNIGGTVSISANPGSTICSGTSVTFTAAAVVPVGTLTYQWKKNGANVGTNSTTYTDAALVNANTIQCIVTVSGGCNLILNSNTITMTVNPVLVPSVSISANPGSTICAGTSVTFTAVPTNGGATPAYQWKVNGVNTGTNSTTFTTTTLTNGQIVTCVLTSNATCASPLTATSNSITMIVNPVLVPSVSISANPGSTICAGTSVTFTAVPTNGGATPAYQWKVNGVNAGTNSATFTTTSLTNGQIVTCVLTSNATCASPLTATSNSITMIVNPVLVPSVSISANPGSTICAGTSVTFTAVPTNGGATPAYQWKVNGVNAGTNSTTFTTTTLTNGQIVTCVLTSNATCASPLTATSNSITMIVNPVLVPSVSISANPGSTICAGTSVTFTAVPTNGGATPAYQWKVNGVNAGTNSTTFTTTTLTNGQIVTCVLTSNATCASPLTATSNSITMIVNPVLVPSVSISANPGSTICAGTSVTFTAVPTNSGATPAYQWKVNGVNAGTNSTTFTTTTLTNGQIVTCVLTSNATCASPLTATSNSITMIVNPVLVPSVSISANPGSTICAGTSVTFTAVPTNGGATPAYQWKVNGVNAGTNSTTFTTTTLTNGQIVTCVLTSNATCASPLTATSNSITMIVNPVLVPSVSISANPGSTICAGTSVTFTAVPTNGGATPAYQWKVNGVNAGTNSTTFTTTTLTNGQIVTCVLTSNATCASPLTATSNSITMIVNPVLVPSVSISANPGSTICAGTSVTFTAVPTNGGAIPAYQWKVNGSNVGTNSTTFTTTSLTNGQIVTCVLTSNATCASPVTVTSNAITISIVAGVPVISSVSPASGPVGSLIVIKGSRFTTASVVLIGSGTTSTFTISGDTMITVAVPSGATTNFVRVTNICGTNTSGPTFTVTSTVTLSLTLFIEGFYAGVSNMIPCLFNLGLHPNSNAVDSVTVQLRTAASPGTVAFTSKGVLNTAGNLSVSFPASVSGNAYYLVLLHRNALQTWSANPVTFSGSTVSYNFSDLQTKTYGGNTRQISPGLWALYSGDLSPQDETTDILDQLQVDNDLFNFGSGYIVTDLSGDGAVDIIDQGILDNNIFNFISSAHP